MDLILDEKIKAAIAPLVEEVSALRNQVFMMSGQIQALRAQQVTINLLNKDHQKGVGKHDQIDRKPASSRKTGNDALNVNNFKQVVVKREKIPSKHIKTESHEPMSNTYRKDAKKPVTTPMKPQKSTTELRGKEEKPETPSIDIKNVEIKIEKQQTIKQELSVKQTQTKIDEKEVVIQAEEIRKKENEIKAEDINSEMKVEDNLLLNEEGNLPIEEKIIEKVPEKEESYQIESRSERSLSSIEPTTSKIVESKVKVTSTFNQQERLAKLQKEKLKVELPKFHQNNKRMQENKDKKMNKSMIVEKEKMDKNKTDVKPKDVNDKRMPKTNEKAVKKGKQLFPKTEKKKEVKIDSLNEEEKDLALEEKLEKASTSPLLFRLESSKQMFFTLMKKVNKFVFILSEDMNKISKTEFDILSLNIKDIKEAGLVELHNLIKGIKEEGLMKDNSENIDSIENLFQNLLSFQLSEEKAEEILLDETEKVELSEISKEKITSLKTLFQNVPYSTIILLLFEEFKFKGEVEEEEKSEAEIKA